VDDNKILVIDTLCPLPPDERPWPEPDRHAELALLGSLAAAAVSEGCRRLSSAVLSAVPPRRSSDLLDLSEAQYSALQEVGGAVVVVVNEQRLVIARTAADAYTAYTAPR
jgi:hypothetical protein